MLKINFGDGHLNLIFKFDNGHLKLILKLNLMRRSDDQSWTKGWTIQDEVLTNRGRGLDHSDIGILIS
jgi:hypothetical protein